MYLAVNVTVLYWKMAKRRSGIYKVEFLEKFFLPYMQREFKCLQKQSFSRKKMRAKRKYVYMTFVDTPRKTSQGKPV